MTQAQIQECPPMCQTHLTPCSGRMLSSSPVPTVKARSGGANGSELVVRPWWPRPRSVCSSSLPGDLWLQRDVPTDVTQTTNRWVGRCPWMAWNGAPVPTPWSLTQCPARQNPRLGDANRSAPSTATARVVSPTAPKRK